MTVQELREYLLGYDQDRAVILSVNGRLPIPNWGIEEIYNMEFSAGEGIDNEFYVVLSNGD